MGPIQKRSVLLLALTAGLALGGCASGERHESVSYTALPAVVKGGFEREYPGATVQKVERETYKDGTVHYEIEFVTRDGKKMEQEFNADGDALEKH